jgi:hypothetical protein
MTEVLRWGGFLLFGTLALIWGIVVWSLVARADDYSATVALFIGIPAVTIPAAGIYFAYKRDIHSLLTLVTSLGVVSLIVGMVVVASMFKIPRSEALRTLGLMAVGWLLAKVILRRVQPKIDQHFGVQSKMPKTR